MPSAIDPSKPIVGTPTTASVRDNFAAAKAEIETLQAQMAALINSLTAPAIITADYPNGTELGPQPTNVWDPRPLNTIIADGGFLVSLAANQFTLPAGSYRIVADFASHRTNASRLRLRNVTTGDILKESINLYSDEGRAVSIQNRIEAFIILPAEASLIFEQIRSFGSANWAIGYPGSFSAFERYGEVAIHRLPQ